MRNSCVFALAALAALTAGCNCGSDSKADFDAALPQPDGGGITPVAPTSVTLVTDEGFEGAMDAVSSPDGVTFYFTAYTFEPGAEAAVFSVPSEGGSPTVLFVGPPLEDPSGLLMSCDGATLLVSDLGAQSEALAAGQAPIYEISINGGAITAFSATGVGEATGLAMSTDCTTVYVAGYKPDGTPAVFTVPAAGGTATVLKEGSPLESPSGVYVDADSIAWVMDHRTSVALGGVLWAIDPDGTTNAVVSDLKISEPAGVSLVAGGQIAVIPSRDADGAGQLITVDTVSGTETIVSAPEIVEPAGIRTATNAAVMALVDADGNAIYRAE